MLPRDAFSDADRGRMQHLLPGQRGQYGGVAMDKRRLLDAVLYVARTGISREDLPERFGTWNSQWRRFDQWARGGCWSPILAALRDPESDVLVLDATAVRAHPCAAGAIKYGTGPAVGAIRRWAGAGANSGPRFTGASTASGTRLS